MKKRLIKFLLHESLVIISFASTYVMISYVNGTYLLRLFPIESKTLIVFVFIVSIVFFIGLAAEYINDVFTE
jgi:hypothetical protein